MRRFTRKDPHCPECSENMEAIKRTSSMYICPRCNKGFQVVRKFDYDGKAKHPITEAGE